ncbi:ABC transporter permease [Flaviaesturariibacter terrae]
MSFAISYQSEMLKTRRTAAFWMSILGAAFIPAIYLLVYILKPEKVIPQLQMAPWAIHFLQGWQALSSFLFPMYIILICALIPQLEFRNNTWKQVWASPQPTGHVFFAKYLSIQSMLLLFFISYNLLMILVAVIANTVHSNFPFFHNTLDWKALLRLSAKTYISVLSITAIQYWLSLRFKSFVAPVGIGLALLIGALIALGFGWEHCDKLPYAFPVLTLKAMMKQGGPFIDTHEWYSLGYTVLFLGLGFLDLKFRKERG